MNFVLPSAVIRLVRCVMVFWVGVLTARAHDPGLSTTDGVLRADTLELVTGFAPADAQLLLPPALRVERSWTAQEFEAARSALQALAPQLWDVRGASGPLAPREVRLELASGDALNLTVLYPRPPGDTLVLHALKLELLPEAHRKFVTVLDAQGLLLARKLMRATDNTLEVPLGLAAAGAPGAAGITPVEPDAAPTFWSFVKLGVEHIWTGYDHLLFLFALLVVCRTFRSIVGIVTCFTLAHSLTLALATLDLVSLPAALVEPAIAASIVFVGLENLWRRGEEPKGRWALTFAFGLIHGFGFAGVLRELGVGQGGQGLALPLFSFNLGVELGQIAIAAIVLPIVWQLRKNERFVRVGIPALSAVVAAAGLYWLLERTVLG